MHAYNATQLLLNMIAYRDVWSKLLNAPNSIHITYELTLHSFVSVKSIIFFKDVLSRVTASLQFNVMKHNHFGHIHGDA